jgi:hypothetical protein
MAATRMNMEEVTRSTETTKGMILLYSNGILHQTYHDGIDITKEDSFAKIKLYSNEYCSDLKRPILVDIRNIKSVSKDSRSIYSSGKTGKCLSAAALLIGNPVSRIVGNFYLGLNKTKMPVRMFTSVEEATDWLKTFLTK